jgi:hypothetical protein
MQLRTPGNGKAKGIRLGKGQPMKRLATSIAVGSAALLWTSGAHAANGRQQPSHRIHLSATTFTLAVAGTPEKGTTFWVSHGPLAGRFGVIQLQPQGNHTFSARVALPTSGVTTFTYLAAQGTKVVHGVPQPRGAVVVIRSMESVTATVASQQVVHWSVPLG